MIVAQKRQKLMLGLILVDKLVGNIGPVETGDEHSGLFKLEPFGDIVPRGSVGGCRKRHPGYGRESLMKDRQAAILGAKIMTPLRHAMRLIDREQGDLQAVQEIKKMRHDKPFRRDIKHVKRALAGLRLDGLGFTRLEA